MSFEFKPLGIPDVIHVQPRILDDKRGFFMELYKHTEFSHAGIREQFVQDNYSQSTRGVLRGLHYQMNPRAQGKLIMCLKGLIFDVAVDLRKNSPHYGAWVGVELSEQNKHMLFVPHGFAHGFQVLSESADVLYKCTNEYSPLYERGILWNDPALTIAWPITPPVLSEKDKTFPALQDADNNFAE